MLVTFGGKYLLSIRDGVAGWLPFETRHFAVPVAVTAVAFLQREDLTFPRSGPSRFQTSRQILDGLRIVQVSDIHLSPFVSERLLARSIDMANETKANIALITGDLISRKGDPLDICFKHLKRLKADLPPLGCLGNHEVYANSEDYTTEEGKRLGITFLRHQNRVLQFGNARDQFRRSRLPTDIQDLPGRTRRN